MEKDIATMKAERIRQYEAYAEGLITREQYLLRKTELTEQIQKIQETLQRFWFVVEKDKTMTEEIIRINEQANEQMIGDKLTKKMVDTFIETVYVYDSKTIEVQFVFDDLLQEAIQKYA
jgi:DNA-binding ferritin-like protein